MIEKCVLCITNVCGRITNSWEKQNRWQKHCSIRLILYAIFCSKFWEQDAVNYMEQGSQIHGSKIEKYL
jgi:hypothetical protein